MCLHCLLADPITFYACSTFYCSSESSRDHSRVRPVMDGGACYICQRAEGYLTLADGNRWVHKQCALSVRGCLYNAVNSAWGESAPSPLVRTHVEFLLPRVLSIHQVKQLARVTPIPLEVFAFGSLCIMSEGRCYLSSYLTGESPNTVGACSPARFVRWQQTPQGLESRLNEVLIDRYQDGENAGYPTLCKGRYLVDGERYHALEEPTSLNTLELLPELMAANIASVKIEGRQRSPAYVSQVAKVWRQAIDRCKADPQNFVPQSAWMETLGSMSEGTQTTLGAYHRKWQ